MIKHHCCPFPSEKSQSSPSSKLTQIHFTSPILSLSCMRSPATFPRQFELVSRYTLQNIEMKGISILQ